MAQEPTADLENIVVDSSWKKQSLVVAVADHTPLELNWQQPVGGRRRVPPAFSPAQLVYNLAARLAGTDSKGAPRRVLKSFPNILDQVNEEDLNYFALGVEQPLKISKAMGFDNPRIILNRALEPYLLYAALRELAANSDERTVNFVYIQAHSGGRTLSNSPLSKYALKDPSLGKYSPEIERFLTRLPPEQVYYTSDISQRLRRGNGVNIIYVESCCAGDLFEADMSPRTVFIATSEKDQINGGYFLNRSFRRAYEGEILKEGVLSNKWPNYPVDITNLKPDGVPFDFQVPSLFLEQANLMKQKLAGQDYKPFKPNVSLVIKSNIRLAI